MKTSSDSASERLRDSADHPIARSRNSSKAPRKLQRCPGCGKGGFINLKAHRCRAGASPAHPLELLAPPNEKMLNECAAEIRRMHGLITDKTRRFHEEVIYDFVEWGLYFLRAKDALGHGNFGDFLKSATVADLNIPERSAQRYMAAARGAGLNEASTTEDMLTLRKSKALHGRTLGDISRPLLGGPNEEPPARWDLVRDTAISLREQCENAEKLRDLLNPKAFSTICARLHRTLESLTKQTWGPANERPLEPFFMEHGDIYDLGS